MTKLGLNLKVLHICTQGDRSFQYRRLGSRKSNRDSLILGRYYDQKLLELQVTNR